MPFLFDSQACESFFRQVRSLTTVYCRVANCSVKEIVGRINKIQLMNDITNKSCFEFPRAQNTKDFAKKYSHHLPTKEQIFEEIEQCQQNAIVNAKQIGLLDEDSATPDMVCKLPPISIDSKIQLQSQTNLAQNLQENSLPIRDNLLQRTLSQLRAITLKNYASNFEDEIPENSPYVDVYNDGDGRIVVKKSSLCWLLREDPGKLSSDRIQRVQGIMTHRKKTKKKRLAKHQIKPIRRPKIVRVIRKKKK